MGRFEVITNVIQIEGHWSMLPAGKGSDQRVFTVYRYL